MPTTPNVDPEVKRVMEPEAVVLVTGASGKTGLAVVGALSAGGVPVRALVHRPQAIARVEEAGAAETQVGDLLDVEDMLLATHDVRAIYHIAPNFHPQEQQIGQCVIQAAQQNHIQRIVYHSVLHPQLPTMPHHWKKLEVETELIETGLTWTILQPASYMQNILAYLPEIKATSKYRVPYPPATQLSLVDLGDVAAVASAALTGSLLDFGIYELSGPQALSQQDVAQEIARAIGRPVQAEALDLSEWLARPPVQAMDSYQREGLLAMFRHYAAHGFIGSPSVLEGLLGRPPTRFSSFVEREVKEGSEPG